MSDNHICGYRRVRGEQIDDVARDAYRLEGAGCSYCGSVSQSAFLAYIAAGGTTSSTGNDHTVHLTGDTAPGGKFNFHHLDDAGKSQLEDML